MRVLCPKCEGKYWISDFRKCSNCLNGWVWVEDKKEAKEVKKPEQRKEAA